MRLKAFFVVAVLFVAAGVAIFFAEPTPERPAGRPFGQTANSEVRSASGGTAASSADRDIELAEHKQKAIWDAEHVTFELEHRFGPAFMKALRERDADGLASFFREELTGTILGNGDQTERVQSVVVEAKVSSNGSAADASGVVSHLLQTTAAVAEFDRIKLRVLKIKQSSDAPNDWDARLLLDVVGRKNDESLIQATAELLVDFQIDDEEAMDREPSIKGWTVASTQVRSAPRLLMEEVTEQVGLADISLTDNWHVPTSEVQQYRFQVAVEDFDRDGDYDIAVGTEVERLYLFEFNDGKYKNVAARKGLLSPEALKKRLNDVTGWIDYDNDGFPDLLLSGRLYHNEAGARFKDVTDESGLSIKRQAMGALIADYDCDGLLDIYVVHQSSGPPPSGATLGWVNEEGFGAPNELWRNEGDGHFVKMTGRSRSGGGIHHTLAGCWFFYDDDHYPDLYLANDFSKNILLRSKGDGTFEDVSGASGTSDFATSMGVAAGDLTNDGVSELYVANMYSKMGRRIIAHVSATDYPPDIHQQICGSCAGNRLYTRNAAEERFEEIGEKLQVHDVGWAYAPAMADFDGDGWLDLYAATGFLSFDRKKPDG